MFSYFLALISCVLLIEGSTNIIAIISSRIIAGITHGTVYLTVLLHACEIADKRVRGLVVSSINLCLMVGVLIHTSVLREKQAIKEQGVDPNRMIGMYGLIFLFIGILLIIFFEMESPVFLLRQKENRKALDVMVRLRCESHETRDIREAFQELKVMVNEDSTSSQYVFVKDNKFPLFIVGLLKFGFLLSFNQVINHEMLTTTSRMLDYPIFDYSGIYLISVRLLTMIVTMFTNDFNRKVHALCSMWFPGLLIATMIVFLKAHLDMSDSIKFVYFIMVQFFTGIGIGAVADIYTSEAFNTTVKPVSIFFLTSIEMILQSALVLVNSIDLIEYFLWIMTVYSGLMITISIILYFRLPDTCKLSLRQARNAFKFNYE